MRSEKLQGEKKTVQGCVIELMISKDIRCSALWDLLMGLQKNFSVLFKHLPSLSFMKILTKCFITFIFQFPKNDLIPQHPLKVTNKCYFSTIMNSWMIKITCKVFNTSCIASPLQTLAIDITTLLRLVRSHDFSYHNGPACSHRRDGAQSFLPTAFLIQNSNTH